jgi:hypothetical protein
MWIQRRDAETRRLSAEKKEKRGEGKGRKEKRGYWVMDR